MKKYEDLNNDEKAIYWLLQNQQKRDKISLPWFLCGLLAALLVFSLVWQAIIGG